MAEKTTFERMYNVPLRKGWLKVPKYKRSKKAVKTLKEFLIKHMKSENIKLGKQVNEHIWKHGIKNPPHHVKITAIKEEDGTVKAELEGFKFKEAIKSKKKEEKATGLKGKLQDALGKDEKKSEEKTEDETPKKEIEEKSKPIAKKTTTKKTSKQKTTKTAKTKNTTKKTETSKK